MDLLEDMRALKEEEEEALQEFLALEASTKEACEVSALRAELRSVNEERAKLEKTKQRLEEQLKEAQAKIAELQMPEIKKRRKRVELEDDGRVDAMRATVERLKLNDKHQQSLVRQSEMQKLMDEQTKEIQQVRSDIKKSETKALKTYKNGTTKSVEGHLTIVNFANGDVKKTDALTGKVVYFYADARTTHTTENDVDIFEFPNGQVERHNKDGTKDIKFPDGTRKIVSADGRSRTRFPDGALVVT